MTRRKSTRVAPEPAEQDRPDGLPVAAERERIAALPALVQSPPITAEALAALTAAVQGALDRRLLAELTVSGSGIIDASPAALAPGVPEGSTFLPVTARLTAEEIAEAVGGYHAEIDRVIAEAGRAS